MGDTQASSSEGSLERGCPLPGGEVGSPCLTWPHSRVPGPVGRREVTLTPRGQQNLASLAWTGGQALCCHPHFCPLPATPRAPGPPRAGDPGGEGPEHEPALDPAIRWKQHHHGLRHRVQEQVRYSAEPSGPELPCPGPWDSTRVSGLPSRRARQHSPCGFQGEGHWWDSNPGSRRRVHSQ